ncbi:MAG TPA: c-type cytochrome [Candidatus Acidoferrales bacterium]|nr:c-type cytochrome [Candidatus Acidoferrales bacterium]
MTSVRIVRIGILLAGMCACLARPSVADVQDAGSFFRQNCSACHTIGGGHIIGPDLQGVTKRKDRAWLVKFLQSPKAMIDSGDPYAGQLVQDAPGHMVMPTVPGMNPDLANALLDYIEGGTASAKPQAAGPAISDRPFTVADVALGQQLFLGERPFENGGPACVSCHTLGTISGLGGGRLGPDLTNVFDRLGGRQGLGAWLSTPPTPTMQSVFGKHALQPEEIFPLLAVIDDANARSQPANQSSILKFFAFGFGGTLVGLALLQIAWRGRIQSVRRSVVRTHARGAQ